MYLIKWRSKVAPNAWLVVTGLRRYETMSGALRQVDWFKQLFPKNDYRIELDSEESNWNRSMAI